MHLRQVKPLRAFSRASSAMRGASVFFRHLQLAGQCWSLFCRSELLGREHFHSNRSSRLAPAHGGMKIGAPVDESSLRWLGIRVGCRTTGSGRMRALSGRVTSISYQ